MNPIGNELILCYQSYNDTVDFRKFGNTLLIEECNINLALLANNNYTTYFYQMYLKLGENFKSIPVRIENNDNNREPNIVKRFFLVYHYDSERQKNFILADRIIFEVRLLNENPDSLSHMQMPILKIHYKLTSYYPENGDPTEEFMFSSNYYMDTSKIMKLIRIFFSICFVLVFLAVAARMYVWCI